ncbi:MAG: hypothetical protein KAQ68_00170 [Clostridiales bacterium]|nr:hypothetical protein [Clostridiales bacterium]
MARKAMKIAFIILIVCFILTACNTVANVIDSKARSAVGTSSRSDEAVQWLIANKDLVIPELVNRISNSGGNKSAQAANALIAMGSIGRQGMIQRFDTMTDEGKGRLCNVLAQQKDKQAVLELLALSEHIDAFDITVSAISSMGDVALNYLSGQLHSTYYQQAIDTALIKMGESAIPKVIQAVHSTHQMKSDRALAILSVMGESAVVDLAEDALVNSKSITDAKQVANIMLKNYPQSSITAIMSAIKTDTHTDIAANILFEVSGTEHIGLVLTQSTLGHAETTTKVLQEYVALCGVDQVLMLVLTGDEAVSTGAKAALTGGLYDRETFTALLNNLTDQDNASSKLYTLTDELITDNNLKLSAQSVIATDTNIYTQVVVNEMKIESMGYNLSKSAHNPVVVTRLQAMANSLDGEMKKQIYTVLASASDEFLPAIVLNAYAQSGDVSLIASQALVQTPVLNGKFLFTELNMHPYVGKVIEGLLSDDNTLRTDAQIILSRASTAKLQNEFYKTIFAYYKDRNIFSILASHYTGIGALPVNLSFDKDGVAINPETISLKITGDVKNVSKANEPDYSALLSGFASHLGLTVVAADADVALEFDCTITPRSKRYSGLITSSFLGAEATGKLTASVSGAQVSSVTGTASILPPEDYPGPSGEFRYKADEEDAPSDEVFIICFINAMYNMWGDEALFGLYNFKMYATSQAVEAMFS